MPGGGVRLDPMRLWTRIGPGAATVRVGARRGLNGVDTDSVLLNEKCDVLERVQIAVVG